jgi:hypothetical protein
MAGRIRQLIDELMLLRTGQSPALAHFVKVNLLLKGIDPDAYTSISPDDAAKIATLEQMIGEFKPPLSREPR